MGAKPLSENPIFDGLRVCNPCLLINTDARRVRCAVHETIVHFGQLCAHRFRVLTSPTWTTAEPSRLTRIYVCVCKCIIYILYLHICIYTYTHMHMHVTHASLPALPVAETKHEQKNMVLAGVNFNSAAVQPKTHHGSCM